MTPSLLPRFSILTFPYNVYSIMLTRQCPWCSHRLSRWFRSLNDVQIIIQGFLKLLLIFCIGLSVPFSEANAAGLPGKTSPVILVMGDSLSAGFRINTADGWVALLQKRLRAEHPLYHVINASISGETSSGGLNRLPAALNKYQPSIVIIELGANDGLRGLPLTLMKENLSKMISIAQQQKARVLLLGMKLPPNYGPRYTQEFAQVYAELARQHQTGLVPFLLTGIATKPTLMQSDGLHPTAAAQSQLLETVWPQLKPLLLD